MSCFSPLKVYWSRKCHPVTRNHYPVFSPSKGYPDKDRYGFKGAGFFIPCRKCDACRLAHSFEWSVRCVCESYYHRENYFLTLTYAPEHLPEDKELCRAHFVSFMKRLRWRFRKYKLKVFYCGEYGEDRRRPHYHAIIFGLPLMQENIRLFIYNYSKKGHPNYYSPLLNDIWQKGLVTVGSFSPLSAAYVAQYTLKKNKAADAKFLFRKKVKPFVGASNRLAIGKQFFLDHYLNIYSRGYFDPFPKSYIEKHGIKHVRPFPVFNKWLEQIEPVLHYKYVVRPSIIKHVNSLELKRTDIDSYMKKLDKIFRDRYYKERAISRRLVARC